jgi:hypothetical protein
VLSYQKTGKYLTAEPFRPFRLKMASGAAFDIRHPEMFLVGRTSAKVYASMDNSDQGMHWHDVSLMLMDTLGPIETTTPQAAKGPQ